MKNLIVVALSGILLLAAIGCTTSEANSKLYYVCNCGDTCTCNTVSQEPGECTCGNELAAMHVLAIENGVGVFCQCGADCQCERDSNDPEKCGCGEAVKKVSLEGKYVCDCGPSCDCGTISGQSGQCTCGRDLKKVI
jgi:hypothetical protein